MVGASLVQTLNAPDGHERFNQAKSGAAGEDGTASGKKSIGKVLKRLSTMNPMLRSDEAVPDQGEVSLASSSGAPEVRGLICGSCLGVLRDGSCLSIARDGFRRTRTN